MQLRNVDVEDDTDLRVRLHTHLRMGHSREGMVTLRTEFSD